MTTSSVPKRRIILDEDSDDAEDDIQIKTAFTTPKTKKRVLSEPSDCESSDAGRGSDQESSSRSSRQTRSSSKRKLRREGKLTQSNQGHAKENEPNTSTSRKSTRLAAREERRAAKRNRPSNDNYDVYTDEFVSSSGNTDIEEQTDIPTKRKRISRRKISLDSDSEKLDSEASNTALRQKPKKKRVPELDEEDMDLDETAIILPNEGGRTHRNRRNAYKEHLAKLKNKKQTPEKDANPDIIVLSDSEDDAFDDSAGMIGDVDIGILNQDEYDLDFIVEDDGDSAQVLEALPAEFRRGKNKELFAIFIHYLICTALNPNFPKQVQSSPDLEDFLHAVHYVDDQIKSRLNLLVSAVWKPDFKHDLETFPIFNLSPHEPVAWCDACGMSGRYSSRRLYLSGVPYDKNTFKWRPPPLPAANSGSDSETSTNHAYDIGRYCAMRSKQYHILYHHKKSLFDSVAAEIEDFEETRHLENERQNQRRISSSEMDNIQGTAESDNGDEDGQKEELIFRNLVERGLVKNWRRDFKDLLKESEDLCTYKLKNLTD